ncbi:hypothetical protein CEXT_328881 [Caerostris extrusa]|uniref:Secreted protein n=1 Tax=Caerostris extrusa TaxID=172846 RepID=A0AAV4U2F3_CAEEX|nr:hypothetical protein CEXT_328881 [Caerostris extrusa]
MCPLTSLRLMVWTTLSALMVRTPLGFCLLHKGEFFITAGLKFLSWSRSQTKESFDIGALEVPSLTKYQQFQLATESSMIRGPLKAGFVLLQKAV